ncbi:MAG: patatin family protein [Breznakibacter sp.]
MTTFGSTHINTVPSPIPNVALVLEGGGFRGIYTAGVLDAFLDERLVFDYLIGVSAGAAYGVSYVSGQYERNLAVNAYVNDPRYCSWGNLFKKGNYFDWEFVYQTMPTQMVPFDYDAFLHSPSNLHVVVTNIVTGEPEYKHLKTDNPRMFRDWLTATSSLPFISKPKAIDGKLYMDGGLSDSIPVHKALADGNQRAVVVLTRPRGYRKKPLKNHLILRLAYRKFPKLVQLMKDRAHCYNRTIDDLEKMEKEGRAFIIRPDDAIIVSRLENNPANLRRVYDLSRRQMQKTTLPGLKAWLKNGN